MTKNEALNLALDALENHTEIKHPQQIHYRDAAITAIKEALAQPTQELDACCAECGKKKSDGWALYCVECIDEMNTATAKPAQEPVAWRNAAIRLGEELSSVGPDGYYDMTAKQWLDWAMEQEPQGKNSLAQPPQRPWVGLTDEEIVKIISSNNSTGLWQIAIQIESALRSKNA